MLLVMLLLSVCLLPGCSLLFPHTERAIQPEGTTLEELGIAVLADIEGWIDSLLYVLGVLGL